MPTHNISRRKALQFLGVSAGVIAAGKTGGNPQVFASAAPDNNGFIYCLNMATIRGHKLGFAKELETASKAGFTSVEIWIDSLQEYVANGHTVKDAKKMLDDLGLTVQDAICFSEWIVDDDATRKKAIEQTKSEMGLLAQLGCRRMAAPGKGASSNSKISLDAIAERYRAILDLSDQSGVVPQLEMWGFLKILSNVSDVLYVAMQSGHPKAKILLDIFHLYKGNTPLNTLPLMNPAAVDILHMNDYPSTLSPAAITDADRTYPGDGVAPIRRILQILKKQDEPLVLSTEVFNKNYYAQDALLVAQTALAKMKMVVEGV